MATDETHESTTENEYESLPENDGITDDAAEVMAEMSADENDEFVDEAPGAFDDDEGEPVSDSQGDTGELDLLAGISDLPEMLDDLPPLPTFDIDAALAAVSSLDAVLTEQEQSEAQERARQAAIEAERQEELEAQQRAEQERIRWIEAYDFPRPPMIVLRRGGASSVIPALLLMATGGYLTFALTLSATPPAPGLVALLVGGVVGLTLISNWLSSGRWARGALFAGLLSIFAGLGLFITTQPGLIPLSTLNGGASWPLLVIMAGIALLLAGVLSRPSMGRLAMIGLGTAAAGLFALATNAGYVCECVGTTINTVWPGIAAVVVVLMLIPVIFRRRA